MSLNCTKHNRLYIILTVDQSVKMLVYSYFECLHGDWYRDVALATDCVNNQSPFSWERI